MQGSETHWTIDPGTNHVVNALAVTGGERADRLDPRPDCTPWLACWRYNSAPLHVLSFIPIFSPLLLFQGSCCIYAAWFL